MTPARTPLSSLFLGVYAGLVTGVSFVATPAKFWADGLALPVALEVGRRTFGLLFQIELAAMPLAVALLWMVQRTRFARVSAVLLAAVFACQYAWLRPALDARVDLWQRGSIPPDSYHHGLFMALEAMKILTLVLCAWPDSEDRRQR